MHREIKGEIKQVQVTRRDALGDVYITFTEDYSEVKYEPKTGKAEGFDFGIKDFLTGSDYISKPYVSPLFYKHNAKTLAEAQKVYSRKVSKGLVQQPRTPTQDRLRVSIRKLRTEEQITIGNLLYNSVVSLISLFFEDLNLRGMKKLWGKQVSDLAFGAFMEKLKHQSHKRIRSVLKIGRWIPTTKCCSVCEHKNDDLTLADRAWTCPSCHPHLDRDHNAMR